MDKKKLPVYKMVITDDESTGVDFISLVDFPAIEVNWVAFSSSKQIKFNFSQDKRIVTGPAMIPDMQIYRYDEQLGEYYVVFEKEQVEKAAKKFFKERRTLEFNYMHQDDSQVAGTQIFESWIITDKDNDKSKQFGYDLPVGTWMVSCYVENEKFWNEEVKTGKVKGFSIEGFLNMELSKQLKQNKMSKNPKTKFAEVKTVDGVMIYTDAEGWNVDAVVYGMDADGNQTEIADGEYTLESGDVLVIASNKIAEVKPMAPAEEEMSAEIKATIESFVSPMLKSLTDSIAALTKQVTDLQTANVALSKRLNIPAVAGVTKTDDKTEVKKSTKMSLDEKIARLAEIKKTK